MLCLRAGVSETVALECKILSLRIKHLLALFVVQAKRIRFHDFPIVISKCSLGLTRHFGYFPPAECILPFLVGLMLTLEIRGIRVTEIAPLRFRGSRYHKCVFFRYPAQPSTLPPVDSTTLLTSFRTSGIAVMTSLARMSRSCANASLFPFSRWFCA